MAAGKKINPASFVLIIGVALAVLYLVSQFFVFVDGDITNFQIPADIGQTIVVTFVILLLAGAVFLGVTVADRAGKPLGRKDLVTFIIIGALVWILWDNVFADLFGSVDLLKLAYGSGQKLGFIGG